MVKIKLAKLCDLDRVKEIAEACAKKMIEDNIFQWNENYPSKEIFRFIVHSYKFETETKSRSNPTAGLSRSDCFLRPSYLPPFAST